MRNTKTAHRTDTKSHRTHTRIYFAETLFYNESMGERARRNVNASVLLFAPSNATLSACV